MEATTRRPGKTELTFLVGTALIAGLLLATGTGSVFAADSDTQDVNVTVQESTIVSVEPGFYNFSGMSVGETNFSDIDALRLEITNDGSTNLTDVYAHLDTNESEPTNPLGKGQADKYAAGGFLWIQNDTSTMYHAGRMSWNTTDEAGGKPSAINDADDNPKAWGFYRNTTGDYLWSLGGNGTSTTNSWCNYTSGADDPTLYIKNAVDTGNNRDLTTNAQQHTFSTSNNDWSVTYAGNGPLEGHFLAAHKSCEKFYIYRFDADNAGPTNLPAPGGNTSYQYLVDNYNITPGTTWQGRVGASVPFGVPAGITNVTEMTITASAP
jgi:hypothetical protein